MKDRRITRAALQRRLKKRLEDADRAWESAKPQSALNDDAYAALTSGISRDLTWDLWSIAIEEALALFDQATTTPQGEPTLLPRLCHLCKRRMISLLPDDDLESLLESA